MDNIIIYEITCCSTRDDDKKSFEEFSVSLRRVKDDVENWCSKRNCNDEIFDAETMSRFLNAMVDSKYLEICFAVPVFDFDNVITDIEAGTRAILGTILGNLRLDADKYLAERIQNSVHLKIVKDIKFLREQR